MLSLSDLELKFFQRAFGIRENLMPNPAFYVDTTGWQTNNANVIGIRDNTKGFGTAFSFKGTWNLAISAGLNNNLIRVPVTPGLSYVASAYVRAIPNLNVRPRLRWRIDAAGGEISITDGSITAVDDVAWTRVSVSDVCPQGATYAFLQVDNVTGNLNDLVWVSASQLEEGTIPSTYGDGGLAGFEWTGQPNASSSRSILTPNSRNKEFLRKDYWAKTSGLVPPEKFSMADHRLASLRTTEPAGLKTINDLMQSFYARQSGLPANRSIEDHRQAFYRSQLGIING